MKKEAEKGFVRIKSRAGEDSYFDSKILDKKECYDIIEKFKNDINEGKKFLEITLVSGALFFIMVSDLEHFLYLPEKIFNGENNV